MVSACIAHRFFIMINNSVNMWKTVNLWINVLLSLWVRYQTITNTQFFLLLAIQLSCISLLSLKIGEGTCVSWKSIS